MMLNYFTFRQQDFTCPKCGWRGKGNQLVPDEFNDQDFIMDLDCPKCTEHIGFWQAPLTKEVEAWKRIHPEWKDGD